MRLAIALVVLALFPASAFAHVTVLPESSRPGQTGDFTFRVPNERDAAATVRVDVFVPAGIGFETKPHDGWTAARISGGVSWTADGKNSIRPGRTEDFKVRLGPLPSAPRVVFKALQYYGDGQIVRWIQEPTADAERPAAVLDLGGGAIGTKGIDDSSDGSGLVIAGLLIFAGVMLLLVLFVWRRRRV